MKSGSLSSTKAFRANLFRLRPSQFQVRQVNSVVLVGVSASEVVELDNDELDELIAKLASTTRVELSETESLKMPGHRVILEQFHQRMPMIHWSGH